MNSRYRAFGDSTRRPGPYTLVADTERIEGEERLGMLRYDLPMKPIHLRAFDLNLFPILDALLDEKSVSMAGERLNLSQSATSSALLRLRELFNDPIVIRQGQRMLPSTRALLIRDELKLALSTMTSVIEQLKQDDRSAGQMVSLVAPEHVQLTLLDALQSIMLGEGADLVFKIGTLDQREMIERLEQCKADIAIGSFGSLPDTLCRRRLYKETMIAVMRRDHPALAAVSAERMTMADLVAYPHLVVSTAADIAETHLAKWLASKAVRREVAVVVEHIAMITEILRNTDFICLGTYRSFRVTPGAETYLAHAQLPTELGPDSYLVEMVWHDRTEQDDVLKGVRDEIHTHCQAF